MPGFVLPSRNTTAEFASLKLSHTCLRVPDYEVSKAWFLENLDFRLVTEWHGPVGVKMGYVAAANDDRCVIEIVGDGAAPSTVAPTEDLFASFSRGGYHHFCFTVPSVNDAVTKLRERGVTIIADPFEVDEIGRKLAFFADPFGNLFEIEEVLS